MMIDMLTLLLASASRDFDPVAPYLQLSRGSSGGDICCSVLVEFQAIICR